MFIGIAKVNDHVLAEINEDRVAKLNTTVEIHTDSHWSGSIMDSGFDSATKDGYGPTTIELDCSQGMKTYSLSFQNQDEDGYLKVSVIQDGTTLDKGSTTAAYGIVTLAGSCN